MSTITVNRVWSQIGTNAFIVYSVMEPEKQKEKEFEHELNST